MPRFSLPVSSAQLRLTRAERRVTTRIVLGVLALLVVAGLVAFGLLLFALLAR